MNYPICNKFCVVYYIKWEDIMNKVRKIFVGILCISLIGGLAYLNTATGLTIATLNASAS